MLIALFLAGGFILWMVWAGARQAAYNGDPAQQALAAALFRAGEDMSHLPDLIMLFSKLSAEHRWSSREEGDRIVHALKSLRPLAPPVVFENAKHIAHKLYMASGRSF